MIRMKRFAKIIVVFALCFIMIFSAACGYPTNTDEPPAGNLPPIIADDPLGNELPNGDDNNPNDNNDGDPTGDDDDNSPSDDDNDSSGDDDDNPPDDDDDNDDPLDDDDNPPGDDDDPPGGNDDPPPFDTTGSSTHLTAEGAFFKDGFEEESGVAYTANWGGADIYLDNENAIQGTSLFMRFDKDDYSYLSFGGLTLLTGMEYELNFDLKFIGEYTPERIHAIFNPAGQGDEHYYVDLDGLAYNENSGVYKFTVTMTPHGGGSPQAFFINFFGGGGAQDDITVVIDNLCVYASIRN